MGTRMGWLASLTVIGGFVAMTAAPMVGAAAEHGGKAMGGARHTVSLTKHYTPSPWTNETGWANRAVGKLAFGAKNLLLGWTELITKTSNAVTSKGNVLKGFGVGVRNGAADTLGGALHLVTFPVTCLDVPLPGGGVQTFSK